MRILHTADWHFGKTIEGRNRISEQSAFVDELCRLCEDEHVDLVLMAGDVYQTVNPSAEAEELFYDAIDRLANHGTRGVFIIAGNHDNPERLMAPAPLCDRLGITVAGLPKSPIAPYLPTGQNRVQRANAGPSWAELFLPSCGETAIVAALPYPSEARLQELLSDALHDEATLRLTYQDRVKEIFSNLATHFRSDTVNLCMSHLFVHGGIESESEIQIQVGGAYAVDESVFPALAAYVGLGHLHRPQWVGEGGRIRYAGSPIAYSFSEAGYAKSVTLVDCAVGRPADIREIPLSSGRPLVCWQAKNGLAEVHQWMDEGRDGAAWIDLEIHLTEGLKLSEIQQLRAQHTGIVHIRPVLPVDTTVEFTTSPTSLPLDQMFVRFYKSKHTHAPDDRTVELFLRLATESDLSEEEESP